MDKIFLNKMTFYGYHGVLPEENKIGQRFIVDLMLELDLSKAGKTDELQETVNYADVYATTRTVVEENSPSKLIEKVAEDIASSLLKNYEQVQTCTVKVIKPDPPIPGYYESVAVEIVRGRV